jgi:pyruvate kinase
MRMSGKGKTKIVATLGPSSRDVGAIEKMIMAGMNVARINASHADRDTIREEVKALREASSRTGVEVGVILDLMGPKIRIGEIAGDEASLVEGREFTFYTQSRLGDSVGASVNYSGLPAALGPGDMVLLDDGAMRLRVLETGAEEVRCRIEAGGVLRSRKGINLPGIALDVQALTEKDLADLELGLELGVDWVALSFIQSARDVELLRMALRERDSDLPIMAKIEKREAVENIDDVVREADAVMVARGDLGVEMPLEEVPLLQKSIIEAAASQGKPVVTATQMLQSMLENPSPTRAEVTDVANAVFDGTDAVMLSGETAVGRYAVESVDTMQRIISSAETALPYARWLEERRRWISRGKVEAICFSACELALQMDATAIVAPTESGFTARQMSRFRPRQPILAPTPDLQVARRLTIYWGVQPRLVGVSGSVEEMFASAEEIARREGYLDKGDTVVVTAGVKYPGEAGIPTTNTIHCVTG